MDHETLEQQTAPESTRGLFDPPEIVPLRPSSSTNRADKRRSLQVFGQLDNNRSSGSKQQNRNSRGGRGHQRSKSASIAVSNHDGNRRNTNFGLHTLAEEDDGAQGLRNQQQRNGGNNGDDAVTVDSLQTMINTLKTLPREPTPSTSTSSNSKRNSRRSSSYFGPSAAAAAAAANQGNGDDRRVSQNGNNRRSIDIQSLLPIPGAPGSKSDRRTSSMMMRSLSASNEQPEDDNEDTLLSREAARAEAEAKLMGTFKKPDTSMSTPSSRRQSARSSMSSDLLRSLSRRYSESPELHGDAKRVSLQLPTVSENGSGTNGRANRRITFNKPLNLGDDTNKIAHRSSRNLDNDWRPSVSSPVLPYSPRSSTYRNSFNLVPFTPTRVNFSRDDANPHQRRPLFIAHLPFSALTPLFRARQLVRGMLRVNKRNRSDAYVACDELDADIYVCGSRDRNRALEGDVVAIRLVDVEKVLREKREKEEAKLARNGGKVKVRLPDEEDENEIIFGGDDDVDTVKPKYCGVVVAILERAQNQVFSGTLTLMRPNNKRAQEEKAAEEAQKAETGQKPTKEAPRIVWFKATDKRVPLIAIPIEQAPTDFVENNAAYMNKLFVGSIKRWPITSLHPFGTLERELGAIDDLSVQTQAILADNNVTDTDFPEAVMGCLPSLPYTVDDETIAKRRDMQSVRVFTIADAGAEVIDNALSIQKLGDDTYEVGVHVSDVTHFIKAHSPMDKEARARAIRVELIHKAVPILPKELTEQVTNLVTNEPRLAFSVVWKLSSAGKILDTWFGKTIIKSHAQFTLDDAQKALDDQLTTDIVPDKELQENLIQDLRTLHGIANALHDSRSQDGIMTQMRDELEFGFGDNNDPSSVATKAKKPASKILKEFLLLANQCVAQKISSQFPEQALLRRHAPPNERRIHELEDYVRRHIGVDMDVSSAGSIERSIEAISDPHVRKMVSVIVLKTMQPPKYFCTGTLDILKYSHYALNVPLFTHFTSPSTRFADMIIHRQLETALVGEKRFYLDRDTVQKLAQHCNVKKDAALYAREQSSMLFMASYLSKRGIRPADANHITVVRREALVVAAFEQHFDVMIPELNLERRIHLANLPVWRSEFDHETRSLTMYWTKGVDTKTGKQRAWSMSDDEEDDMDEEALLEEMHNGKPPSPPPSVQPEPTISTQNKRASMVLARLSESTNYSTDLGTQTIKALDKIQVLITVEMVKTPPLIRVLGANPYA
ncbi:RNB-domain-containing protein [Lichtheimia hyalospora FSU 10163]|nr:RNB-domain-containing protein [Lichtheimia hyalospora FSU 10163]